MASLRSKIKKKEKNPGPSLHYIHFTTVLLSLGRFGRSPNRLEALSPAGPGLAHSQSAPPRQARPAGGIPEGEAEPHPRDGPTPTGHKAGSAGGKPAPGRSLSPLSSTPSLPGGGPRCEQEPQKPHSGIGEPSGGRKGPSTSASSRGAAPEFPRDLGDRIRGSPGERGGE